MLRNLTKKVNDAGWMPDCAEKRNDQQCVYANECKEAQGGGVAFVVPSSGANGGLSLHDRMRGPTASEPLFECRNLFVQGRNVKIVRRNYGFMLRLLHSGFQFGTICTNDKHKHKKHPRR